MKALLSIVFLFSTITSVAQHRRQNQFIVTGKIINNTIDKVYLSYRGENGPLIRDSSQLQDGRFRFSGFVKVPTMAYFSGKVKPGSVDDPNTTSFYIEPGEIHVSVKENTYKEAKITGSKTQIEYQELEAKFQKIRNRWSVVFDTLEAANKRSNFEYQELKNWVLVPYNAEVKEVQQGFLRNYPVSFHAPQVLYFLSREMEVDSIKKYYARFPHDVKATYFGKEIAKELEKRKIGIPGTNAFNFSTIDINDNKLSLSDYKGNYVLLDFWASWCLPCRKGNPHLLDLYATYKSKGFEIIGIASDDRTPEAWKKAVAKDKIGVWKHVLSGFDMEKRMRNEKNEKHIGEQYNISTLPTKILIDRNGVIIGRYGESKVDSEALDKMLSKLLGNG